MTGRIAGFVVAGAVLLGALLLVGGHERYTVYATFDEVDGLRAHSEVQVHGVRVGSVADLTLNDDDTITAKLELDRSAGPVGPSATAHIRAKNLLGARLVDLDPGDTARALPSGARIPPSRTGAPTDLDDVLNLLDPGTRARLRIFVNEFGLALGGRGAKLNALLDVLPRSLDQSRQLVSELAASNEALAKLLGESDRFLSRVTPRRAALASLVSSANAALHATSDRHEQLQATISEAPGTLAQLRRTLTRLETAAGPLEPAARALQQTSAPLTSLLRELPRVESVAVDTIDRARITAPQLTAVARHTTPLVRRLRTTASAMTGFADTADPVTTSLLQAFPDLIGTLEGWTRAIQNRDGLGHVFRGELVLSEDLTRSLIHRYVRVPSAKPKDKRSPVSPKLRLPGNPGSTGQQPPLKPIAGLPDKVREVVKNATDDITGGKAIKDVSALLDYLLGK